MRQQNIDILGETADLNQFFFGSERAALAVVRPVLIDIQQGRCFYCNKSLSPISMHIDHFIAWSPYPIDLGHNFVLADNRCNSQKHDQWAMYQASSEVATLSVKTMSIHGALLLTQHKQDLLETRIVADCAGSCYICQISGRPTPTLFAPTRNRLRHAMARTPGDWLIWNQDVNNFTGNAGPIGVVFNTPVSAAGAQIQADFFGAFTASVCDQAGNCFVEAGNSNSNGDGSAIFIGIANDPVSHS